MPVAPVFVRCSDVLPCSSYLVTDELGTIERYKPNVYLAGTPARLFRRTRSTIGKPAVTTTISVSGFPTGLQIQLVRLPRRVRRTISVQTGAFLAGAAVTPPPPVTVLAGTDWAANITSW